MVIKAAAALLVFMLGLLLAAGAFWVIAFILDNVPRFWE